MPTTFRHEHVTDPRRPITVEVGDAAQEAFLPQLKTIHWGGECMFSVRLADDEPGEARVTRRGGAVEWRKGARRARWYPLPAGAHDEAPHLLEDGGHEFEVHLSGRPESNVIRFTVRARGLVFHRQERTHEEGEGMPDCVEGSYAVYHESRMHNFDDVHYRTGKAFHLLRPHAEDANGNRVWCDLQLPADGNGEATITVPAGFLAAASYPVVVDPTIGYTTIGASTATGNILSTNSVAHLTGTYAAAGTEQITDFNYYGGFSPGYAATEVTFAAYTFAGGVPVNRLAAAVQKAVTAGDTTPQWWTASGLAQALAAATYTVAIGQASGETNAITLYRDTVSVGQGRSVDTTHTGLPATWTEANQSTSLYSLYATYGAAPLARRQVVQGMRTAVAVAAVR